MCELSASQTAELLEENKLCCSLDIFFFTVYSSTSVAFTPKRKKNPVLIEILQICHSPTSVFIKSKGHKKASKLNIYPHLTFHSGNDFIKPGVHFSNNVWLMWVIWKSILLGKHDSFLFVFGVTFMVEPCFNKTLGGCGIRPLVAAQSYIISAASVIMSARSIWEVNRSRLFCSTCRCDPIGLSVTVRIWGGRAQEVRRHRESVCLESVCVCSII